MSSWKYVDYVQRMNDLPPTAELAARVCDGEALKDVARSLGMEAFALANRFRAAGYMPTGETERDYRRRLMKEHLKTKLLTYREPWMVDAVCVQTDPDSFFPEVGESSAYAKRICQGCSVREVCLEWALERKEPFGVLGGLSERDRRKLLKERAA
jgi:hypothetical protein